MESNWDPGVRRFFLKIVNSISWTILWMLGAACAGIYYELGYTNGKPVVYTILFYVVFGVLLIMLIRHLMKTWKDEA